MKPDTKPNFSQLLLELAISILIPTLILKKLSADNLLGANWALVLALALPLGYGLWQFARTRRLAFVPILGFVSILLTGGIGLLHLDAKYIAIKEALIPFIIGVATLVSIKTPYPLVKTFLYNDMIIDTAKIEAQLAANNNQAKLERALLQATLMLAASFFLSAILNYVLAKIIVTAQAGSALFNDQLGTMNLLSYPVIVLPSMVIMVAALVILFNQIKKITGLALEEILRNA